jgi:hypothetical protein
MGYVMYSNCSTITTGCYIYTDIYKTSPASNGYWSDGTNCYTVEYGNGYVYSVDTCFYSGDVYITAGGETTFNSSGDYSYSLFADSTTNSYGGNPVCVQASPLIGYIEIYSAYGYMYGSGVIGYNARCGANDYVAGAAAFDPVYSLNLYSISPSSAGSQTYYVSGSDIGSYACTTPLCYIIIS